MKLRIFVNKSNSLYRITKVYNSRIDWKCVITKVNISFFSKPSGLEDIFIIPTEDKKHKKCTKANTLL